MNFYSCQSTEVEGGRLTVFLRVSWPRSQASCQETSSSTAGMGYQAGVRIVKAHCLFTQLSSCSFWQEWEEQ